MKIADIAQRLTLLEESTARIELALALRVPPHELRRAMQDVLETLGLVGMLKEVHFNQRDQLAMLVGLAAQLLMEARDETKAGAEKRDETNDLLIQLRELGRKHVRGLADLERAQDWHESQAEQRVAAEGKD